MQNYVFLWYCCLRYAGCNIAGGGIGGGESQGGRGADFIVYVFTKEESCLVFVRSKN